MFYLICARINYSVNNRRAGDLRRHRAHYDVIVMVKRQFDTNPLPESMMIFFVNRIPPIVSVYKSVSTAAVLLFTD